MRHAARTMPGLFQLLPSYDGAVKDNQTGQNLNIFDSQTWQTSLVNSLAARFGAHYFQARLDDAKAFADVVGGPWGANLRDKACYAYGIGSKTWLSVGVDTGNNNRFRFDNVTIDEEGDGTVHKESSFQPDIPGEGHRTFQDGHQFRDNLAGQHANMPNHQKVQDWILGLLEFSTHSDISFDSIS
ncbi:MAG: hypothetical protein GKR89_09790 [Candidatus Latescibacteria bacterium]|nr:hypothetical protein [Candidatus Latescibacterota bacterium]